MELNVVAIGSRIKSIRINLGMTLNEFGNLFGASKSIASRWEKGISIPNAERKIAIAKVGRMTVDELLYGKSEREAYLLTDPYQCDTWYIVYEKEIKGFLFSHNEKWFVNSFEFNCREFYHRDSACTYINEVLGGALEW